MLLSNATLLHKLNEARINDKLTHLLALACKGMLPTR